MFHSNKLFLFLLLLFFPLLTNCTEKKPDSIGFSSELDVILDPNIDYISTEQVETSIYKFRIRGIDEPFFEQVSIRLKDSVKIPRNKNLLLILESGSPLFNNTFADLFDPQFLKSLSSSDYPVTIVKNDLFYRGQRVYIILTSPDKIDTPKLFTILSQMTEKIIISSIGKIRNEIVENYDEKLSQILADSLGIPIQIPIGYQLVLSKNDNTSFLMRRGVGSKTEEWIVITHLTSSVVPPQNRDEFIKFRTKVVSQLIQFSDGSLMQTRSAEVIDSAGFRFRGEWVTEPYPMSGIYTGKIVKSKKGKLYIEAGVYSPGRSKTLNLLRHENFLNFNR